jgi:hypothetical protein
MPHTDVAAYPPLEMAVKERLVGAVERATRLVEKRNLEQTKPSGYLVEVCDPDCFWVISKPAIPLLEAAERGFPPRPKRSRLTCSSIV